MFELCPHNHPGITDVKLILHNGLEVGTVGRTGKVCLSERLTESERGKLADFLNDYFDSTIIQDASMMQPPAPPVDEEEALWDDDDTDTYQG